MTLPCDKCKCGYGQYRPYWCPILGREIRSVDEIPMYHAIIPTLGKLEDGCMGFTK